MGLLKTELRRLQVVCIGVDALFFGDHMVPHDLWV